MKTTTIHPMKKRIRLGLILFVILCLSGMTQVFAETESESPNQAEEEYTLDKMVVLSRHNIRSPLSGSGSMLGDITPHEWFKWTSNPSELSLRGGVLETIMGQYFRQYLEEKGLFPENYQPEEGAVRFYANSKQRTLATTNYFSSGLLPVEDVTIESHAEYDTMDPVFNPALTFFTDSYAEDVVEQIAESGGEDGLEGIHEKLTDAIELLMDVTDMEESDAYQEGKCGDLLHYKTEIVLEKDKEAAMTGPIKTATSVADALTLQYYEEPDPVKAAFGHELTKEDWLLLHSIVDTYTEMLFSTPLIAVNAAHPLLEEIRSELTTEGRKFTFLCGHDSNIASVLAALGVEEYELPDTVEPKTPIGVKLVLERYLNPEGEAFYDVSLVYQSTQQLRDRTPLSLENPPMKQSLRFEGIETNEDGLIAEADLLELFDRAIQAYDSLQEEYQEETELAA